MKNTISILNFHNSLFPVKGIESSHLKLMTEKNRLIEHLRHTFYFLFFVLFFLLDFSIEMV